LASENLRRQQPKSRRAVVAWFDANRDHLVFDPAAKSYVVGRPKP
jgi:hypothetical protein